MCDQRRLMELLSYALSSILLALCGSVNAAPFVDMIEPPALQRGTMNRVVLRGSELEQAIGVWSSSTGAAWQGSPVHASRANEATFEITVPKDTPLGILALRLVTKSGFSNVHLILVDELPIQARPADNPMNAAMSLALPSCVTSRCRTEAGSDRYAFDAQANQRLSFEIVGSRLGTDFDPLVTVLDANGRVLARRDNDVGLFFDSRFAHTFATAGRYVIEVRDSRYESQPHWNYALRVGDFPAARVAVPSAVSFGVEQKLLLPELGSGLIAVTVPQQPRVQSLFQEVRTSPTGMATWLPLTSTSLENRLEAEPNNDLATATPAVVPGLLNGVLSERGDTDFFALDLKKGQALMFEAAGRELGSPIDVELVLFDASGKEVRRVDDFTQQRNGVSTSLEARFDLNVGQDGLYKLQVRDLIGDGGSSFAYRIEVAEPKPELELVAEYSAFTVPQKSWQPLPISVTRTRITGPIELELVGAPAGVTLEPRVIPADATEFVGRLIASESAAESISTLHVIGICKSADGKLVAETLVRAAPLIDRQLKNKDRIPYSLRDNQLFAPPSLPTRLALQVTPPAPFTVDLPFEELLLTKYQTTNFPIETTRAAGFVSPISFSTAGGQIGTEAEERDNVFVRIPDATGGQSKVEGTFFNRILTRYEKKRADLTAIAEFNGHRVTLIRPFSLDVRSAFKPTVEPAMLSFNPGESSKLKILANRTSTFSGEIKLELQQPAPPGLNVPEVIIIPANQPEIEIPVSAAADFSPRRVSLRYQSTGYVGKYEEEVNEPNLTLDVVKPK